MNLFYLQAILTASVGGILFGYDMGVISGALPLLSETFQLTPSQEEWIVSLLYFGGGVGAATGGFICDWRGRKFAILVTDVMFGLGAFMLCSAQNVITVMVGRFVVGWAVAVSGIADVAYLHEISSVWEDGEGSCEGERVRIDDDRPGQTANADDQIGEMEIKRDMGAGGRGSVVSVNEACISVGFLLAYGVAFALGDHSQAWRIMFAFGGLLAVLQFLGMLFMPESPVFLRSKGRIREAERASCRIRGIRRERMDDSPCQLKEQSQLEISQSAGIEMKESAPSPLDHQTETFSPEEQLNPPSRSSRASECLIFLLISIKSIPSHGKRFREEILVPYRKQFAIASFLAVSSQTCGHVSVLSFSEEIFAMLNSGSNGGDTTSTGNEEDEMLAIKLTVGIGILKLLTTCLVILFIEKGGRRGWMLSGMSLVLLSLLCLCVAFRNVGNISEDAMQQMDPSSKNDLGIAGVYGIAVGYAASYGPLNWLITSELFEPAIRGRALGFATVVTYLAAGLVSRTFLSLQGAIGLSATFALYWVATFVSMLLAWMGLPDTGGERTPAQITLEIDSLWLWGGRQQPFLQGKLRSGNSLVARSSSWLNFGRYRYGSAADTYDMGLSPDPSLDDDNDESAASGVTPSSPIDRSGLTPRRSSTKEII
ncbi:hypothetical protein ACHAXT_007770 [Thalassiosira profunda]